jgi:hypothetical protein
MQGAIALMSPGITPCLPKTHRLGWVQQENPTVRLLPYPGGKEKLSPPHPLPPGSQRPREGENGRYWCLVPQAWMGPCNLGSR